jgi:Ca-activated chloride channel family protein
MRHRQKILPLALLLSIVVTALGQEEINKQVRVAVDIVLVNAIVTNANNEVVTDLRPEDFALSEDKVQQDIQYFSTESGPISLGIIFDVSGSMERDAGIARDAAITFLKNSTEGDEYFLVTFNDKARLVQDFTTNIEDLRNKLPLVPPKGATAMYDALYLGLSNIKKGVNTKKALLLITDGMDNSSRYTRGNIRELLRESDVQVYSIDLGYSVVGEFSEISGGHSYRTSINSVWDTCRKIAAELKNQYILGYVSTNTTKDGSWRKIHARVNRPAIKGGALTVRAREGYYANMDSPTGGTRETRSQQ